ncbi:tetratricopeptide repeat protein [Flavobacteriaceae bacterium]|jgi:tetratricopeptide (TPR) repeat protein|nr:tetratricopeptide repeat protein [Flavobacteriaceae bacterium]MDA9309346.1 tetratricopeptide repeat protein [Flavobacteriaceae bacterium]
MQLPTPDEHNNVSLSKFESMLKTNNILFFDSDQFEEIINHYLENGKIALAKKATKLGLQQHPSSTTLKLFQVEMFIFENELDIADILLDELYQIEQSNEEIYIQKANILSRRDQHKHAIVLLEKALEITLDQADVLSLIGMEYLFLEDYENAKNYFIRCLNDEEDQIHTDYSALYNVIYCFEYLEQNQEAIHYLNVFLDKNPYSEVAWHQIGKQYSILKQYKKALASFDFAIISDDRFIGAYLEKGKVLEKMKRYELAIESFIITLGLDDPTSFALLRIGKCYEKIKNDEMALQYYTKCVEQDGLLDKGWIAITDFHYKKKDYKKALYFIDKAINIDSENVLYWKRYAKINKKLQWFEEAEVGYRKALEFGNYEQNTWLTRCDILIKLGEFEGAINNLQQAAEFYPDSAEIEFRLAGLYYDTLKEDTGAFHLKNALDIEPEFMLILEEIFPHILEKISVKEIIKNHKKTTL